MVRRPIADLPDLSAVSIGCRVDEADRARVRLDSAVRVGVDAIPDREFEGRITAISLVARPDFTSFPPVRNFDVVVSLTDTDPARQVGHERDGAISSWIDSRRGGRARSAVFLRDGRPSVYIGLGRVGRASCRDSGAAEQDRVAIASGLTAGERIALTGSRARGRSMKTRAGCCRSRHACRSWVRPGPVGRGSWRWSARFPPRTCSAGSVETRVYAIGDLRAARALQMAVPPMGGQQTILALVDSGTPVKAGDVVVEFDAAIRSSRSSRRTSTGSWRNRKLLKAEAEAAVKAADEEVALLDGAI